MKLIDELYQIQQFDLDEGLIEAKIVLDKDHLIYKGHFPGFPVTPGVIQIKMIEEIIIRYLNLNLKLQSIAQCKFLQVINPEDDNYLSTTIGYNLLDDKLKVNAVLFKKEQVAFKLQAVFSIIQQ